MNVEMLEHILGTQSCSGHVEAMNNVIISWIEALGGTWYSKNGNIYATKGNAKAFPCVVAHTDTVHRIVKANRYRIMLRDGKYNAYNPKTNRYTGIGGDDKVGIYIALEAFARFPNMKVAFFRDEEIGCQGSRVADMQFFKDVGYVFQCDRQGYGDFINNIYGYELFGKEFSSRISDILKSYNFKTHEGALTDVYQLKRDGLNVAVANMSCGYHRPHTPNEYINVKEMRSTLHMVLELIEELGENTYEHKGKDLWADRWDSYRSYGTSMDWEDDLSDYNYIQVNGKYVRVYNQKRPVQSLLPGVFNTLSRPVVAGRTLHECPNCGTWCFWLREEDDMPDCSQCELEAFLDEQAEDKPRTIKVKRLKDVRGEVQPLYYAD